MTYGNRTVLLRIEPINPINHSNKIKILLFPYRRKKTAFGDWWGLAILLRRNPRTHTDWLNWLGNKKIYVWLLCLNYEFWGQKKWYQFYNLRSGEYKNSKVFLLSDYSKKIIRKSYSPKKYKKKNKKTKLEWVWKTNNHFSKSKMRSIAYLNSLNQRYKIHFLLISDKMFSQFD